MDITTTRIVLTFVVTSGIVFFLMFIMGACFVAGRADDESDEAFERLRREREQ